MVSTGLVQRDPVDFRFDEAEEGFREEVRSWLGEHLRGEYAALGGGGGPADERGWDVRLAWEKELGEAGWIGLGWPEEYGGRGATIGEQGIFDEERTCADLVVGGVNNGWKVAMGTLGFERGTAFLSMQLRFDNECQSVIEYARKHDLARDPLVRQKLADAWIGVQIMKYNGLRTLTKLLATGSPGPEASTSQLYWSTWHQRLGELE